MPRPFSYSTASRIHLSGVTAPLRRVFESAIDVVDLTILDGIRTMAEQIQNVRNGVSKTLQSKHLPQPPDNLSHAVDAAVYPVDWGALQRGYDAVKKADPELRILEHYWAMGVLFGIAKEQGVKLRQGIDWNQNSQFEDQTFNDLPHSEML